LRLLSKGAPAADSLESVVAKYLINEKQEEYNKKAVQKLI
jgi:hypothetical protein